MGYRVCAVIALLCTAVAQGGCASKLDFDHVSAGKHVPDAGESGAAGSVADASVATGRVADARVPDASGFGMTGPREAGITAPDASAPTLNTPSDAAVGESSPPDASDPAADAGLLDAGPEPNDFSCSSVSPEPYFCDDFESLTLNEWDHVEVFPVTPLRGGSIEVDDSVSRAGQASLLVHVDEGVSSCVSCLSLYSGLWLRDLPGPTQLTVEFDLRVDQIDPTSKRRIVLFQIVWGTPETGFTYHTLQLESAGDAVRAGLVEFAVEGQSDAGAELAWTPYDHKFLTIPALSQWVHVRYMSDAQNAGGATNFAVLTVDGVELFAGFPQLALYETRVRMEIGVPWVDMSTFAAQETSKSWQVRYDNVLVRYEPR